MSDITITLPDAKVVKVPRDSTPSEIVQKHIGVGLAKAALAAVVNDVLVDMDVKITKDAKLKIITFNDKEGKEIFRHSTAHVFALAIQELYPNAKNTIGPAVEEGFYYDFDDLHITPDDFEKIEKKMEEIVKQNLACKRIELTLDEAKHTFKNNPYKIEMASEFSVGGNKLSAYKIGDKFIDLCRGPHVPSTGCIKSFKLTKVAAAYWRGDAKNKQLTRVYGISFPDKKQLKEHFTLLEEAAKRDHRKLGVQHDLWSFSELSPGAPFFHPKGTIILNELQSFLRKEYLKRGYKEVFTPQLFHKSLWETSGHWQHYRQNMFQIGIEGQEYALKAMNCPGHMVLYKTSKRSYRELPLRMAEFGIVHRNELSGTLSGLFRVRKMMQDDTHIFCMPSQIKSEVAGLLDFMKFIYQKVFNFDFHVELSTKPDNAMGDPKLWAKAEEALESVLKDQKMSYKINKGDGAFYGPKIDVHIKDAINRTWQCATIQLDFQMPERFSITYEADDGHAHHAVVIHRALLGSLERFIGVLTEHFAAKFPLWLSPVQVKVLTIVDRVQPWAEEIVGRFNQEGIRVETDFAPATLNKKVRDAQLEQVNYILVVGEKESEKKTVTVRTRDNVVHGEMDVDQIIQKLKEEIRKYK